MKLILVELESVKKSAQDDIVCGPSRSARMRCCVILAVLCQFCYDCFLRILYFRHFYIFVVHSMRFV